MTYPAILGSFKKFQRNVTTLLRGITENDFQGCFQQWHHHLMKHIVSEGEYLEANSSH
jgi:hypothetical protein